jgi:hypothetical protein
MNPAPILPDVTRILVDATTTKATKDNIGNIEKKSIEQLPAAC